MVSLRFRHCLFISLLLTFFEIAQQVYAIKGPTHINGSIGEDALFMWNTTNQKEILAVRWGIRKGNIPDPHFISVNKYDGKVHLNEDIDATLKERVEFIGNLPLGRAWFVLKNLTANDTNEYIVSISDDESSDLQFYVSLNVTEKGKEKPKELPPPTPDTTAAAPNNTIPTTVPATTTTMPRNITTTPTPTTPPPSTTPAPSNNYVVILNGTFNVTKDNNCSDIEWYIKDQTKVVFLSLLELYNVTVKCKAKPQSLWFVVNLNLWFKTAVAKSTVESYVKTLQQKISSTSHFSFTVIAKPGALPPATDGPTDETPGLTKAEIAGIVIGVILGVVIIAVIIVIVYKKLPASMVTSSKTPTPVTV